MASGTIIKEKPHIPSGVVASNLVSSFSVWQVGNTVEIFVIFTPTATGFQNLLNGLPAAKTEGVSLAIFENGQQTGNWIKIYPNGVLTAFSQSNQLAQCEGHIIYLCE